MGKVIMPWEMMTDEQKAAFIQQMLAEGRFPELAQKMLDVDPERFMQIVKELIHEAIDRG